MNFVRRQFTAAVTLTLALALVASACGSTDGTSLGADESTGSDLVNTAEAEDQEQVDTTEDESETSDEQTDDTDGTDGMAADPAADGVDTDLFFDGALAEDVTTEDCSLSDGTSTTCYRITIVGSPADHEIGPFCPTTTDTDASEAGIWFDGDALYDLDGAFIQGLAELYDDENWLLYDDGGQVNVTDTAEAFEAAARPNVAAEYQNHCVEGRIEWLDGGEAVQTTVLIPTSPVVAASTSRPRGDLGVTLNGVTIAAAAPVDAILGAYTIAAFDDCGGHINPVAGYHLHGAVGCGEVEVEGHANIFGYALDGFGIYSPYDEDGLEYTGLDDCGGHMTVGLGYHYHASAAAENSVIGCLSGETAQ